MQQNKTQLYNGDVRLFPIPAEIRSVVGRAQRSDDKGPVYVLLALYSGATRTEIARLCHDDLHTDNGKSLIRLSRGVAARQRDLPIPQFIHDKLQHFGGLSSSDTIFDTSAKSVTRTASQFLSDCDVPDEVQTLIAWRKAHILMCLAVPLRLDRIASAHRLKVESLSAYAAALHDFPAPDSFDDFRRLWRTIK